MTTAAHRRRQVHRVTAWRRKNPGRSKMIAARWYERRHGSAPKPFFPGQAHAHRCVRCRGRYVCVHACDPAGEGLTNSICNTCFEEAASKCPS